MVSDKMVFACKIVKDTSWLLLPQNDLQSMSIIG
jgi:hypothetical protein